MLFSLGILVVMTVVFLCVVWTEILPSVRRVNESQYEQPKIKSRAEEYFDLLSQIPATKIKPCFNMGGRLVIALFEFRNVNLHNVINAALRVYEPNEIGLAIVYGNANKETIERDFASWENVLLVNTNDTNHDSHSYSNRLLTPELWENFINWSHVLVYHYDALILRKIPEIFFAYDYVGAPGGGAPGGNGGFSLRNVRSMIKCCEPFRGKSIVSFECPYMHEDCYFSHQNISLMNNESLHKEFAIEGLFHENPVGLHKAYHWITNEDEWSAIRANIKEKLLL